MKILQILILSLIPSFLAAQSDWLDSLNNYIETKTVDCNIPGLAIGIIKDNEVIFKSGYGVTDFEHNNEATTETIFPIVSCTKAFTLTTWLIFGSDGVITILLIKGGVFWGLVGVLSHEQTIKKINNTTSLRFVFI